MDSVANQIAWLLHPDRHTESFSIRFVNGGYAASIEDSGKPGAAGSGHVWECFRPKLLDAIDGLCIMVLKDDGVPDEPKGDPDYNAVSSREAYERAWEDKRRLR